MRRELKENRTERGKTDLFIYTESYQGDSEATGTESSNSQRSSESKKSKNHEDDDRGETRPRRNTSAKNIKMTSVKNIKVTSVKKHQDNERDHVTGNLDLARGQIQEIACFEL